MLKRWICRYTQYENQIDVYNEIVSNGLHPDSSSWDLRKTFELMKDPRVKNLRISKWSSEKIKKSEKIGNFFAKVLFIRDCCCFASKADIDF